MLNDRIHTGLSAVLVCLALLSASCSFGIGTHRLDNMREYNQEPIFDGSLYFPMSISEKLKKADINGTVALDFVSLYKQGQMSTTGGSIPKITVKMTDFRAGLWRKLFTAKNVEPYVGLGMGWFKLSSNVHYKGDRTGGTLLPSSSISYYDIETDTSTLASGLFPFFETGISVKFNRKYGARYTFRKDFGKTDSGYDLSGNQMYLSVVRYLH